ncbi:hypothetical protein KP509_12G057900 [Ceratopteris richardii]|nr:hypothetical protein KP509_12G057900 [Ceratopteris richardii]
MHACMHTSNIHTYIFNVAAEKRKIDQTYRYIQRRTLREHYSLCYVKQFQNHHT